MMMTSTQFHHLHHRLNKLQRSLQLHKSLLQEVLEVDLLKLTNPLLEELNQLMGQAKQLKALYLATQVTTIKLWQNLYPTQIFNLNNAMSSYKVEIGLSSLRLAII